MFGNPIINTAHMMLSKRPWGQSISSKLLFSFSKCHCLSKKKKLPNFMTFSSSAFIFMFNHVHLLQMQKALLMLHFFLKHGQFKNPHSVFIRYRSSVSLFGPTNELLLPFPSVINEYRYHAALHNYTLEVWWRDKVVFWKMHPWIDSFIRGASMSS